VSERRLARDVSPEVVVVGGGVIGCAIARELAVDRRVLLLERDRIAAGATGRAAGEVTMSPSYPDYPGIAAHANAFFDRYDATGAIEYVEAPSVEPVSPDREEAARARVDRLRNEVADGGLDVAFESPDAVERRWPALDMSGYAGAVRFANAGYLDPAELADALRADAEESGARVETGVTVTGIRVDGEGDNGGDGTEPVGGTDGGADSGSVVGVETDHGAIDCSTVVAAAGWRTRELLAPDLPIPIRPYRTQCVVVRSPALRGRDVPMGWLPGPDVYFRPMGEDELLVGGRSAAVDDPAAASRSADEAFREHASEIGSDLLADPDPVRIVDDWAGVDAATPDTRPIVDRPAAGPDGLAVATGFHGRGIMTAPVAATLIRHRIEGTDPPFPGDPFALSRFEDRSADFRFASISDGG
jgi:glycine/D-amino acid oxidase-like deaminating enzyme